MDYLKVSLKYILITFLTLLLLFLITESVLFYKSNFKYSMAINIRFKELGPIYSSMPVYYKGYKIGKTKRIKPSHDYKYTIVQVILYPENLSLPENIGAKVKKLDNGKDYIEVLYPNTPSLITLKNNATIEGTTAADIESFMSAQIESGVLSSMGENMNKTLSSIEITSYELNGFFKDLRVILQENRPNIKKSTDETREILENVNSITKKIDNSLPEENLKNITRNMSGSSTDLKGTTENLLTISQNINEATKDLDKTMAKIDATVEEAHTTAKNASGISCGIKQLLEKRFAGLRLFFGKPTNPKNYPNCKINKNK